MRLKIRVSGRHPRFFRKQVEKPNDTVPAGSLVYVKDKTGRPVGTGFYNGRSTIALRMLHRGKTAVGPDHVFELLERSLALREDVLQLPHTTNAYRLVHAEGDGIPGLILDRLGPWLVAQVLAKAIEPYLEEIGEGLLRRYPDCKLALRVDRDAARLEGIDLTSTGDVGTATLREAKLEYDFRPGAGHKTGFFCDQRENRALLGARAKGRRVLDLCCNSGGFAMHAARGGAKSVEAWDLDEEAVALARTNAKRNELSARVQHGDAFEVLRGAERGAFDCIVLDPPKWVSGDSDRERGLGRYLDANQLALRALDAGGLLLTCSCSGSVSEEHFLAILREAAARAGRDARILRITGAGPDHPVALECPETRYLKAVWLEVR